MTKIIYHVDCRAEVNAEKYITAIKDRNAKKKSDQTSSETTAGSIDNDKEISRKGRQHARIKTFC